MGSGFARTVPYLGNTAQAECQGDQGDRLKMAANAEQRKSNKRLGLILLSVALVFGLGFVSKIFLFGF